MTRPAMGDERRWAARYQFLEELWRGRDRIVCDRELETALHGAVEGPLAELLAALVPGEGSGERAWVALHNDRRAASFARERSGTVFASVEEAAELASDEGWQVALVHLSGTSRAELANMEPFLEVLGERLEDDPERSVVLSLPCTADEDASYELLAELVEELFGDGRIYGLTQPTMAAFYDFGPVLEPAGEQDERSGEADIEVDNVLGSETPRFEAFIAVVGASIPGEGVTFIELPGSMPASAAASAGDDDLAALRVQLAEAQRRGDMQAIERQSLLEKLEQAEDRIASLEDQLDKSPATAPAAEASASSQAGPRVDELLAREQTLRWEIERLRGEVERLEARPVEELEAEVASLRAELDRTQLELELATAEYEGDEADADDDELDEHEDELDEQALAELARLAEELEREAEQPTAAQVREWRRARSKLEHLLRKLERGGRLSALELHRELVQLKNLL
ncbi:MAG TPA: hypothetical protein VM869_26670 [Enhygromyxa sp.]|nr:hypothetical protein [Enhygromyxa sp.]